MYFQLLRTALDRYLVTCLPAIALVAFLGATVCILQMFRYILGYVQYDRSAPPLLINLAFVTFLVLAEASWFIASLVEVCRSSPPRAPCNR